VGYAGTILTSKDGVRWTLRCSGTEQRLQRVAFVDGRFVAAGWRGVILTSSKGLMWTPRKTARNRQ